MLNISFSEVFPLFIAYNNYEVLNDGGGVKVAKAVQDYFPDESNLCLVESMNTDKETFQLKLSVPVVVFSQEEVLHKCSEKLIDSDGYILIFSNTVNLEVHTVLLLKCFNQTTLKLKTKYILVIDASFVGTPNKSRNYISCLSKLWKAFGIINVSIFPIQDQIFNNSQEPTVFIYNPFLANNRSSIGVVIKNNLSVDIRDSMVARFRNLNKEPLRVVFVQNPVYGITNAKMKEKKKLSVGVNVSILFKQTLESYFNISFDVHEVKARPRSGNETPGPINEVLGKVMSAEAEFSFQLYLVFGNSWPKTVQLIQTGLIIEFIFIVPMPREVESWRLFLYL